MPHSNASHSRYAFPIHVPHNSLIRSNISAMLFSFSISLLLPKRNLYLSDEWFVRCVCVGVFFRRSLCLGWVAILSAHRERTSMTKTCGRRDTYPNAMANTRTDIRTIHQQICQRRAVCVSLSHGFWQHRHHSTLHRRIDVQSLYSQFFTYTHSHTHAHRIHFFGCLLYINA